MVSAGVPRDWDALHRSELRVVISDLLRKRVLLAPVGVTLMALFVWYEPAPWRRGLLLVSVPIFILLVLLEGRRARQGRLGERSATANVVGMMTALLIALVASGGIESPAAGALFFMVVLAVFLTAPAVARLVWIAAMVIAVALATVQALDGFPDAIPEMFGGQAHHPVPVMAIVRGFSIVFLSTVGYVVATRVREAFERVADRAGAVSRAALDGMVDESRTMALLTAEIAHELKNPLASVKGLAGLVARDLDGKPAERMAVLRREVDRMATVLEQFLTLSRPLVPLEVAPLDARELCDEVAALHEGMAADRQIRLEVTGPRDLALRGDARKLTQVLVNLVQNALAASPVGATVELGVARGDAGIELTVLDRGPGLAAEVADRVFEPGVTTRGDGSGLGLVIARTLTRQHGGDVELAPRAGGGLAAVVRLPAEAAS